MKKRLLKFALPIVLGVALMGVTLFGLVSCEPTGCNYKDGGMEGNNGECIYCPKGAVPAGNWYPGCSSSSNQGIYCC